MGNDLPHSFAAWTPTVWNAPSDNNTSLCQTLHTYKQ